jgi:hypothetical protein
MINKKRVRSLSSIQNFLIISTVTLGILSCLLIFHVAEADDAEVDILAAELRHPSVSDNGLDLVGELEAETSHAADSLELVIAGPSGSTATIAGAPDGKHKQQKDSSEELASQPNNAAVPAIRIKPSKEVQDQLVIKLKTLELHSLMQQVNLILSANAQSVSKCQEKNVLTGSCAEWIIATQKQNACINRGKVSRESCERLLIENNSGVFPGCEDLNEDACQQHMDVILAGHQTQEMLNKTDDVIRQMMRNGVVAEVEGVTSINERVAHDTAWIASVKNSGIETSEVMVVFDRNDNDVPDDVEMLPGFEAPGALPEATAPVVYALANKKPIEQPIGAGEFESSYAADYKRLPTESIAAQSGVILSGICEPNAVCSVFIYSYIPTVLFVETDEYGNWTYDLQDSLADGVHTVYVSLHDADGRAVKKGKPFSFFVKHAKAVSEEEYFSNSYGFESLDGTIEAKRFYAISLVSAVFLLLCAVLLIKDQTEGDSGLWHKMDE